jgi:hypothetical protein
VVRPVAVHLWLMRDEPKVFIGGGKHWDGSAREADADELEALAERFRLEELRAAAGRVRQELLGGVGVALLDGGQDAGNFAQGASPGA